jgi:hypothetical protein
LRELGCESFALRHDENVEIADAQGFRLEDRQRANDPTLARICSSSESFADGRFNFRGSLSCLRLSTKLPPLLADLLT